MTYNYKELNDIIKEFTDDETKIAVIPDTIETAKGKDKVLRIWMKHQPTSIEVVDTYRDHPTGFRARLKQVQHELKQKVFYKQITDGTADPNSL